MSNFEHAMMLVFAACLFTLIAVCLWSILFNQDKN